jgi:hypothetical protein
MSCGGERQLSAYSVEKLAPTGMSDFSRFDFEEGERLRMPGGRLQEPPGRDFESASRSPRVESAHHRSTGKGFFARTLLPSFSTE